MNKRKVYPGYFVLGALIIYLVFMVIPGLIGIGFSFTDWSAYTDELNFVGWENFKTIFLLRRTMLRSFQTRSSLPL